MTQYSRFADPTAITTRVLQSADPVDLQNQVNAYLESVDPSVSVIVGLTLAGAGDGHTFAVTVDVAPYTSAFGGLVASYPDVGQGVLVRCYLASDKDELPIAKTAAGIPTSVEVSDEAFPYLAADDQLAGGAKGTRFMGMTVFVWSFTPTATTMPYCIAEVTADQAFAADVATILTFDASPLGNQFTRPVTQAIQYNGIANFYARVDLSLTVEMTLLGTFTAEIVADPLGTPVAIGSVAGSVDVNAGSENVSVFGLTGLVPSSILEAGSRLGLRLTPTEAGSILSGRVLVTAVPVS